MVIVNKGLKVRIYPSSEQKELFASNFGASRFVYNSILEYLNYLYRLYPGKYKLNIKLVNDLLMELKKRVGWLSEVESTSLQQASRDLLNAYLLFFKNPNANFPKFHSRKYTRLSFRQTVTPTLIQKNKFKLRKYGLIRYRTSKEYIKLLNSNIKINNITITCDNNKYYAIVNVEVDVKEWEYTNLGHGFDLNSNKHSFLVSDDGTKYRFDINRESQAIKRLNRSLSTKQKGSRAFRKVLKRLQKAYNHRTNKLNDYCQKLSTKLVKENDTIVIESNWSSIKILIGGEQNDRFPLEHFKEMIKYKFNWYKPKAKGLIEVNPKWTSKTCHKCGHINNEVVVQMREWECPKCHAFHDRDINSAINIFRRGNSG